MNTKELVEEILKEREYQNSLWGTEFDDNNTINDWVTYIVQYAGQASSIKSENYPEEQRKQIMKVATLAVAAIEAFDRNGQFAPRHYEGLALKSK